MDLHLDLSRDTEKRLQNFKNWIDANEKQRKYNSQCECVKFNLKYLSLPSSSSSLSSSTPDSQMTPKDYSMKTLNKRIQVNGVPLKQ